MTNNALALIRAAQVLPTYNMACRIIAGCANVDQVKDILDESVAMKVYARQAKNLTLEADCVAIRMRATRRLGELMQAQKATVGLAKGGQPYQKKATGGKIPPVATLAEAGIGKDLVKEARKLGTLAKDDFETKVEERRAQVPRGPESWAAQPTKRRKMPPPSLQTTWLCATQEARADFVNYIGLEDFWIAASEKTRREWVVKRGRSGGFKF